ncbi:hypothetical protein [Streptomyces griseosporeus]|uniref:hypothetical protein n=1 Tax=Streptomyces griseosporeus TaxID=1910 RepID=UPI0037BB880A
MPRNQSTAAQRARAKQRETGAKYTTALRETIRTSTPRQAFSLRELLVECTTSPAWTGRHPEIDPEWAPRMFDSALLGGPVPYTTVLRLTGGLAAKGLSAEMTVESRQGCYSMVVACGGRRFQLALTQDDWIAELCLVPGCEHRPVAAALIPYCEHQHLVERSGTELAKMAWLWGDDRHQEFDGDPAAAHTGNQGDALIVAAVAQGAFPQVAAKLVESCYENPDLIEEIYFDEAEATAVRHAMDNEHLRLKETARKAAARIRKLVGGLCVCGRPLHLSPEASVPARYCSAECASSVGQPTAG